MVLTFGFASEIKQDADLLPPGAPQGSVPTDMNQATGLERIEILGKMEGRDVWDLKPLDASRLGTYPIQVLNRYERRDNAKEREDG